MLRGSWPLWAGAAAIAVLQAATLLIKGSPWGVTSAFALWGSKLLQGVGVDVSSWAYWSGGRGTQLTEPVLTHSTSIMDIGIIVGALLAATVGGTFVIRRKIPLKTAAASLLGGIVMGYGARLAFGCNIGAYLGGITSFSLHGWVWGAAALGGTVLGLKLLPTFGMKAPSADDGVC